MGRKIKGRTDGCWYEETPLVKVQHPESKFDFLLVPEDTAHEYDEWVDLEERLANSEAAKNSDEVGPDESTEEPDESTEEKTKSARRKTKRATADLTPGVKAE